MNARLAPTLMLTCALAAPLAAGTPAPPAQLHAALAATNPHYTRKAIISSAGGRIVAVDLRGCRAPDLSALTGLPLEGLGLSGLAVTDLSPVRGMPLRRLAFSPETVKADLTPLRRLKTLTTIGVGCPLSAARIPAGLFWLVLDSRSETPRAVATLRGHRGAVHDIELATYGTRLASAGADGTVRLWDATRGECLRVLRGHRGAVRAVGLWPYGRRLVSVGDDGTLRVWHTVSGACLATAAAGVGALTGVGFCMCCGHVFASSHTGAVVAWDGKRIVRTVQSVTARKPIVSMHSLDYHYLATADGELTLWGSHSLSRVYTLRDEAGRILCGAIAPHVPLAVAGGDHLLVWRGKLTGPPTPLPARSLPVLCVVLADEARLAAVGSQQGAVELWDLNTRKRTAVVSGHKGPVRAVTFSYLGDSVVSAGDDGTIRISTLGGPHPIELHRLGESTPRVQEKAATDTETLPIAGFADEAVVSPAAVHDLLWPRGPACDLEALMALTTAVTVDWVDDLGPFCLAYFGSVTEYNVFLDREAAQIRPGLVTLKAKALRLDQALRQVAQQMGLVPVWVDDAIFVTTPGRALDAIEAARTRRRLMQAADRQVRAALRRTISFDFVDTPLPDVVAFVSSLTGIPVVLDPGAAAADETVTLRVTEMPLGDALKWITRLCGLVHTWHDGALLVSSADLAAATVSQDRARAKLQQAPSPAIAKRMAQPISFDFVETPLQDAVASVARAAGVGIVIEPRAVADAPTVTLRVKGMPRDRALRWLCRLSGRAWVWRDGKLLLTTPERATPPKRRTASPRKP